MALKIRLTKVGSVHQPLYRVVVAEARSRRDGAAAAGSAGSNPPAGTADGGSGGAFDTAGSDSADEGQGTLYGTGGAAGTAGTDGKALEGYSLIRFIGAEPTYSGTVT